MNRPPYNTICRLRTNPVPRSLMSFAVIIHEKGGQPRRQEFNKNEVTIGRVQGNDIILPKQNVSKRHSRIVVKDGKFIIVDLKSTNGTYVNGRKIASPMVIKETDKIYIGDFILSAEPLEAAGGVVTSGEQAARPAAPAPARLPRHHRHRAPRPAPRRWPPRPRPCPRAPRPPSRRRPRPSPRPRPRRRPRAPRRARLSGALAARLERPRLANPPPGPSGPSPVLPPPAPGALPAMVAAPPPAAAVPSSAEAYDRAAPPPR
ncbi:MAG: FHA domain-containing protein [bacterium]